MSELKVGDRALVKVFTAGRYNRYFLATVTKTTNTQATILCSNNKEIRANKNTDRRGEILGIASDWIKVIGEQTYSAILLPTEDEQNRARAAVIQENARSAGEANLRAAKTNLPEVSAGSLTPEQLEALAALRAAFGW